MKRYLILFSARDSQEIPGKKREEPIRSMTEKKENSHQIPFLANTITNRTKMLLLESGTCSHRINRNIMYSDNVVSPGVFLIHMKTYKTS